MHFDDDGGWETVSREHDTAWLFVPYDLAEDIWTERAGANPSRLTLCRWMTANHWLFVVLASDPPPGSDQGISWFRQDPRFNWVPIPAGSDLDLQMRASRREFCYGLGERLEEEEEPIVRTSIH
jgi:hypothetical protein